MDDIYQQIRDFHRQRDFAMRQRTGLNLRLLSLLRLMLGWRKDLRKAQSDRIKAEAKRLAAQPEPTRFEGAILGTREGVKPLLEFEHANKLQMGRLARKLPVWKAWAKGVIGFGEVSLAVIVGEAGDLSLYDDKSKLWKRLGLAAGQNHVPKGLSREERAKAWISRGYNPRRRSQIYVIGDAMISAQVRIVKDDAGNDTGARHALGVYGQAYLDRKRYEIDRAVANGLRVVPAEEIPEKNAAAYMSLMHVHRRAQRYMEKKLIRDLWRAWRRANVSAAEKPENKLPIASNSVETMDIEPETASLSLSQPKRRATRAMSEKARRGVPVAEIEGQEAKLGMPETATPWLPPASHPMV